MLATANFENGNMCAILHGCDQSDVEIMQEWLNVTKASAEYPLLLPALFAELQLRSHKTINESVPDWSSQSLEVEPDDYDSITKEVLRLHQRVGFLEQGLGQVQKRVKQMVAQTHVIAGMAPEVRRAYITVEGARIRDRVEEMIDDYEYLIGRCRLITDGASILIAAMFNLIAQRDNRVNQSIAVDSRELAAAARRDGSAVKTIAVLTLIFLPGTFVAAFFAMPLLDRQAPKGQHVASDRFWIYWAVTLPMTAAVLIVWFTWYFLLGSERAHIRFKAGAKLKRNALHKMTSKKLGISLQELEHLDFGPSVSPRDDGTMNISG